MNKQDQTIIDTENGDCTRACLASILDLPIDAVPNFIRFKDKWFFMMKDFLNRLDYDIIGTGFPLSSEKYPHGHKLQDSPNVNGYVIASVPSKTFLNIGHSVVIDLDGVVVHDPNPNKLWQDINVLETKDLKSWMLIEPTCNYTRCLFSINEYDNDGDLSDEGIYLHFGNARVKIATNKKDLDSFECHLQDTFKEIRDHY